MAQTFTTNANNDIFILPNGNLSISFDLEAVLQLCKTGVQALLGEMVLAVDQGIPDFQTVWNGVPNIPQWEAAVQTTVLNTENVIQILNLTTTIANNTLNYTMTVLTTYGVGTINA